MSERETPPTLSITPTKKKKGANWLAYVGIVVLFGPIVAAFVFFLTNKPKAVDEIPANPYSQYEPVKPPVSEAEKKAREQAALKQAKADMKNFTGGEIKLAVLDSKFTTGPVDPKKAEGYTYAGLQVAIRNDGSKTARIEPSDFTLLDGEGLAPFPSNAEATKFADRLKGSSLTPSKKCTGWLIFIVPKSKKYTLEGHGIAKTIVP